MNLLVLIGYIVVIAVIMWAVNKFGAQYMQPDILKLLNIVVVIALIFWIIFSVFGVVLPDIRVGG